MYKIYEKKFTKKPINIGYENTVSLKELAEKIFFLAKKKLIFTYNLF